MNTRNPTAATVLTTEDRLDIAAAISGFAAGIDDGDGIRVTAIHHPPGVRPRVRPVTQAVEALERDPDSGTDRA